MNECRRMALTLPLFNRWLPGVPPILRRISVERDSSPDPGGRTLSFSRHCSNCNVRRSFHSLALSLSISKVEMLFSGAQQLSILQSFPFPITDRLNDEIFRERTTETFWNTLIK